MLKFNPFKKKLKEPIKDLFMAPGENEIRTRKRYWFRKEYYSLFWHVDHWCTLINASVLTSEEEDAVIEYLIQHEYSFVFSSRGRLQITTSFRDMLNTLRPFKWSRCLYGSGDHALEWTGVGGTVDD